MTFFFRGTTSPNNERLKNNLHAVFLFLFQYCNGGDLADYLNGKYDDDTSCTLLRNEAKLGDDIRESSLHFF